MGIRLRKRQPRESGLDDQIRQLERREEHAASHNRRDHKDDITHLLYGPGTNPFRYTPRPTLPSHIKPPSIQDSKAIMDPALVLRARRL